MKLLVEDGRVATTMKALVYLGPGKRAWQDRPRPRMVLASDAIVRVTTTPMLLRIVESGRLDATKLISHRFELSRIMEAYDTFGNAAQEGALKVMLSNA